MHEPLLLECLSKNCIIIDAKNNKYQLEDSSDRSFNYNRPSFYTTPVQSFNDYLTLLEDNSNEPFLIFNSTLECPQMSLIQYESSTVSKLNDLGLHIYLSENVVKYTGNRVNLNRSNLKDTLHLLENNDGLINGKFTKNARAFQLDSIQDLIKNNNLTNVTVYTPEVNLDKFSTRYNNIKFKYYDIDTDLRIIRIVNTQGFLTKSKLKYKFINTNWRYEPYRYITASYLINFESKISWHFKMSKNDFKRAIWFDINNWDSSLRDLVISGQQILDSKSPLHLDTLRCEPTMLYGKITDRLELPNIMFHPNDIKHQLFSDVFCAVVTESGFLDPTSYISEKTILAIWNSTPFVIVGPPNTLQLLKSKGFKTFENFWDESYDQELDHETRLKKVFAVIAYINSLSYKALTSMLNEMQQILIHNKETVKRIADEYRSF